MKPSDQNKAAPLKSASGEKITDKNQQLERWVEHYSELYATENIVSAHALDAIDDLPVIEGLDLVPTLENLSKAINSLSSVRAPGSDGIPPDLIKHWKTTRLQPLHELLCQCWQKRSIPQNMDPKIITLYKNRGDRGDFNNYRGISLLSVVGKVFARVIVARLQKHAERVYPESQCGFRSERSTIDMTFSVRQLQEKCHEQQMPWHLWHLLTLQRPSTSWAVAASSRSSER